MGVLKKFTSVIMVLGLFILTGCTNKEVKDTEYDLRVGQVLDVSSKKAIPTIGVYDEDKPDDLTSREEMEKETKRLKGKKEYTLTIMYNKEGNNSCKLDKTQPIVQVEYKTLSKKEAKKYRKGKELGILINRGNNEVERIMSKKAVITQDCKRG